MVETIFKIKIKYLIVIDRFSETPQIRRLKIIPRGYCNQNPGRMFFESGGRYNGEPARVLWLKSSKYDLNINPKFRFHVDQL